MSVVNQTNAVKIADSTRKKDIQDVLPDDPDGLQTVAFLKRVQRSIHKITGDGPQSLGIHPVVYFYTGGGSFQPAAFLATLELLNNLEKDNKLKEFIRVRRDFEEFLVSYKEFLTQIVHKVGSGSRSIPKIFSLYQHILELLWQKNDQEAIIDALKARTEFVYLSPLDDKSANDEGVNLKKGKKFSRGVKSAAFLRDALQGVARCSICESPLHKNSIQIDHVERKSDGGAAVLANAKPAHPFCNSTVKH
jgi:hypothetical protein